MCDCRLIYGHKPHDDGKLTDTINISYCPLHAAAPRLLETLVAVGEWIMNENSWRIDAEDIKQRIDAAIAAAEPEEVR